MSQVHFINDQSVWNRAADALLRPPVLALDTEANNPHAYHHRICLIQIGTATGEYIVDPLAVKDLSLLGQALLDPSILKVIHSAANDLSWLDRDYGFTCQSLFDTEVAAKLLGFQRPNLAALVKHYLSVDIPKSRSLQRSDWTARPLTSLQMEYAANDVRYLTGLALSLKRNLQAAGRLEWTLEEFRRVQQVRHAAPRTPEEDFLQVKGIRNLDPRQLAVLRELYLLRDDEAKRRDRPPFQVMNNEALFTMARYPRHSGGRTRASQLVTDAGLPHDTPGWLVAEITDAIERGWSGPEFCLAQEANGIRTRTDEQDNRLKMLKNLLADLGLKLGLNPALLWPTVSLERMALAPETWRSELSNESKPEVRQWQLREFRGALVTVCASPEWQAGLGDQTGRPD